jgi:predicted HAD superfamily hydrolase
MYKIIDNLIFPAPKAGYNESSYPEKLIYIPKHSDYFVFKQKKELKNIFKDIKHHTEIESLEISDIESIHSDSVNIDNTPSPPRMRNINSS